MAVRPVITWGDARLAINSTDIGAWSPEMDQLVLDLVDSTAAEEGLGMAAPEFVADDAALDALEMKFDRRADYYSYYLRTPREYDRSRADAALGARRDLVRRLPPVTDLIAWYAEATGQAAQQMALAA